MITTESIHNLYLSTERYRALAYQITFMVEQKDLSNVHVLSLTNYSGILNIPIADISYVMENATFSALYYGSLTRDVIDTIDKLENKLIDNGTDGGELRVLTDEVIRLTNNGIIYIGASGHMLLFMKVDKSILKHLEYFITGE